MGFFKYPYTDLNELNLDWVIAKIKYIEQASHIIYDNTGSGLVANNVQDAIDEIVNMISSQGVTTWNGRSGIVLPEAHDYKAAQVDYVNTNSGLTATDVQAAVDEVQSEIAALPITFVESFNARTGSVTPNTGDYNAGQITYDNTVSGLTATDTQAAIDELAAAPGGVTSFNTRTGAVIPLSGDYHAEDIYYDNTTSGMTATDTQAAIDELDDRLDNFSVAASQVGYDNSVSGLTATNAQDAIDEIANDVLSSGVASFNGRTGAVNSQSGDYDLTDLGDVVITSPTNDQVLKYDSITQKWVNGAGGGGGGGTAASTSYDNTSSGLTAANVQDAIDEVVTDLTGKYAWVEEHVISESTTDTRSQKYFNAATALVNYLATLANDEFVNLTYMTVAGSGYYPMFTDRKYTNADSSVTRIPFNNESASNRYEFTRIGISSTTISNCERIQVRMENPGPVLTITDLSSASSSSVIEIHLQKYKKIY